MNFIKLYDRIRSISQTVSDESENAISETASRNFELSWSHYLKLMRIDDENERKFYEIVNKRTEKPYTFVRKYYENR